MVRIQHELMQHQDQVVSGTSVDFNWCEQSRHTMYGSNQSVRMVILHQTISHPIL